MCERVAFLLSVGEMQTKADVQSTGTPCQDDPVQFISGKLQGSRADLLLTATRHALSTRQPNRRLCQALHGFVLKREYVKIGIAIRRERTRGEAAGNVQ